MRVAALILAAGRGSRYRAAGGLAETKLVETFRGDLVVRHAVRAALGSRASPVMVVTGYARSAVEAALDGLPALTTHNAAFATGLASSLRAGISALRDDVEGVVVLLADMPLITASTIDALVTAAEASPTAVAVVPVREGRRGNPVLLRRALFGAAGRLTGDEGARRLLRDPALPVAELAVTDAAVQFDLDEPDAFR